MPPAADPRGRRLVDDSALMLFNWAGNDVEFRLPSEDLGSAWYVASGTAHQHDLGEMLEPGRTITRPAHSVLVLMRPPMDEERARPEEQTGRSARA